MENDIFACRQKRYWPLANDIAAARQRYSCLRHERRGGGYVMLAAWMRVMGRGSCMSPSQSRVVVVMNSCASAGSMASRARRRAVSSSPKISSMSRMGAFPVSSWRSPLCAICRAMARVRCWPSEANSAADKAPISREKSSR